MFAGPHTQSCACRVVAVKTQAPVTGFSGCIAHGNRNRLTQTGAIEVLGATIAPAGLLHFHLLLLYFRNSHSYLAKVLK
jgi:hypothetical protein